MLVGMVLLSFVSQVGNCVAKRNYRFFYLFLCSIFIMAIFVMGCNIAVIVIGTFKKLLGVCMSFVSGE